MVNVTVQNNHALAIGSKVEVYLPTVKMIRFVNPYRGFQSSVDPRLHFGLASNQTIDSLVVTWPDGTKERLLNIEANQHLTFNKNNLISVEQSPIEDSIFLWEDFSDQLTFEYLHEESDFVDFKGKHCYPISCLKKGL